MTKFEREVKGAPTAALIELNRSISAEIKTTPSARHRSLCETNVTIITDELERRDDGGVAAADVRQPYVSDGERSLLGLDDCIDNV